MILLALLASAMSPSVAVTQKRVNQLVASCKAAAFVALSAETSKDVVIEIRKIGEAPSPADQRAFACVLDGMKKMDDLQFGFLGNEAVSEAKSK